MPEHTHILPEESKKKLTRMAKQLKKEKSEIDSLFSSSDYSIPAQAEWDDVSALRKFEELKFDPLENLYEMNQQLIGMIKKETEKDKPSMRILSDLMILRTRLLSQLMPYRYSRVNIVQLESKDNPEIQIILQSEESADELSTD